MDHWNAFTELVSDLLKTESVNRMRLYPHHRHNSCYEHSVFVAYTSYRVARFFRRDEKIAARAGLMHDLYLYDVQQSPPPRHYFTHSAAALINAKKLYPLSPKEENIILSHMWPMSKVMPKSMEAFIVNLCDNYCTVIEFSRIWYLMKLRKRIENMN